MINKKCIKCGAEDAKIEFKGERAKVEETDFINGIKLSVANPKKSEDEKMLVTCSCCGYVWLEKPLDGE